MKGGINKIVRNIVATKGKSDFEKRLIKATYHMDSKEPKEKHVIYLIECLRGTNPEIRPSETLNALFSRFLKNISSWALTTKIFVIFHRCLQDPQLYSKIAQELKAKEHLLHSFQKKASDTSYEAQMYAELSQMYSNYIKFYVQFLLKSPVLNIKMADLSQKAKSMSIADLLFNYENFDALITQIFNIFEHQNFCKRTRLWQNVIFYLFTDLIRIYKVFYVLITEVLERFPTMNPDQATKSFVMYQNFVNLTNIMKSKSDLIMIEFGFHMRLPEFFKPDASLVETLRVCVNEKQSNPSNLAKVSQQLRGGMNRNQFQTAVQGNNGSQSQVQQFGTKPQTWVDPYEYAEQSYKFSEKQDSDSGEDFDYGEEEDGQEDKNVDLLAYISNMDFSHMQGGTTQDVSKSSSSSSKTSSAQNTGEFFNFGEPSPQVQNKQPSPPVQQNKPPSTAINQDLFSLFDNPVQNSSPNVGQGSGQGQNLLDINKPLIPSNPQIQQLDQHTNQLDMFKNLYTNIQQKPVQPLPQMNPFQSQQQQQPSQMMGTNQFMGGYNQFQTGMMMPGQAQGFNQQFMTGQGYGNPQMYQGQMMGNYNQGFGTNMQGQGMNPMMMQQQQQFPSGQFMTNSMGQGNMNMGGGQQQQQQQNTGKEFTFW